MSTISHSVSSLVLLRSKASGRNPLHAPRSLRSLLCLTTFLTTLASWCLISSVILAQSPVALDDPPLTESIPASQDDWFRDQDLSPTSPVPHDNDIPLPLAQPPRNMNTSSGGPGASGNRSPFTAQLVWMPTQKVKGQDKNYTQTSEEINVAFPLRIHEDGIWLGLGSIQRLEIGTGAVLPDSAMALPDQIWDIEFGVMHLREFSDGKKAGAMLRVGSPSDQPFAAIRDMTVSMLGFLTLPHGDRNAWNLSLFYSPTGQIIFPVPGIAYVWRPSDEFTANLGIPFSIDYQPTPGRSLSINYTPLTNAQVLARQSLNDRWSVYASYRAVTETFFLADRSDDRLRLYLFDQRLSLGLERQLVKGWSCNVAAAYVYNRQIFQGQSFSRDRIDQLSISPGIAGSLQLQWSR